MIEKSKSGPIRVFEDDSNFLVAIHPRDRARAKQIPGRQWDGIRKVWVYEKSPETFTRLADEFRDDADAFDIRMPKTKRSPELETEALIESEENGNSWFDLDDLSDEQPNVEERLDSIDRALTEVMSSSLENTLLLGKILSKQSDLGEGPLLAESEKREENHVERNLEELLLDDPYHLNLLQNALVEIAIRSSGSADFEAWIRKHSPLASPRDFVSETHELLKEKLERLMDIADSKSWTFSQLVQQAQEEKLFFTAESHSVVVPPTLRTLNGIRNRFAHARGVFRVSEQQNRAIAYLMNLALVWEKLHIGDDAD